MKSIRKKITVISIYLFIFCIGTAFLISCEAEKSENVNQERIYTEYELLYDKVAGKTYASASFKFGSRTGTPLQLTAGSEVKFNGQVIPYDPLLAYYRLEIASPIATPVLTGTFVFKDKDGKIYTNIVDVARPIENPAITTITKSAGAFTYTWDGASIATNESIGFYIANVANPLSAPQGFVQITVGATNIVVSTPQVNQFPTGPAYLTVERQIEFAAPSANAPGGGGLLRGKYIVSKTIDIQP